MPKIDALTGVRFLAALWVSITHFRYAQFEELGSIIGSFVRSGGLAVPVFFVLSGYILAHNYRHWFSDKIEPKLAFRFFCYRLAQIYPLHFATLTLALILILSGVMPEGRADDAYTLALNIVMVQAWGLTPHLSWNMPACSVSSEWLAYLIFPAVVIVLVRFSKWGLVCGVVAGVVLAGIIPHPMPKMAYGAVTAAMFCLFVAGACCRLLTLEAAPGPAWDYIALAATAGLIISATVAGWQLTGPATTKLSGQYVVYACTVVLIPALGLSRGAFAGLLGHPIMVQLGEISFALYLCHIPAIWCMRAVAGYQMPLMFEVGVALAVAAGLHHFLGKPARKCIRAWLDRTKTALVPVGYRYP